MASKRSDSFSLNSSAPLIIVCPSAREAAIKRTGNSSIRFGTNFGFKVIPFSLEALIDISAQGSYSLITFESFISAPISFKTSNNAIRVLLIPIFINVRSEPGVIKAAKIKKAADEKSPGILILAASIDLGGKT